MAPVPEVSPDAKSPALSRSERRKLKEQARADALQPLQHKLQSQDPVEQLEAIDELFIQFEKTSLDTVLAADVLPWVLQLSQENGNPNLQTQALWALQRFSEGTSKQINSLVQQGALKRLTPLLTAKRAQTQEQVLQIITNVARASEELRDEVIHAGIVDYVTGQFNGAEPLAVVQKATVLLRAICAWPCTFADGLSKRLLSTLSLLLTFNDACVLINASEALATLPHTDSQHLAVLLLRGTLERLVFLLESPLVEVLAPACRALQRIACASKTGMQALLVYEPVPALKELMESDEPALQLESIKLVGSTIAFGGPHVEEVLRAGCVPVLLERLAKGSEAEIRRAAAKGVCYLMKRAPSPELWKAPTVGAVLEVLPCEKIAMDFLVSVLKATHGELSQTLEEAACNFLEDCHFDDQQMQEQVEELTGVLQRSVFKNTQRPSDAT